MEDDRIPLLLIFGSIVTSYLYIDNTNGFQTIINGYLPFLARFHPTTVGILFIITCFVLAVLFKDKNQHQQSQQQEPLKPIVQPVIIKLIIEKNRQEGIRHRPQSKQTRNKYHNHRSKKKLKFRNYWSDPW